METFLELLIPMMIGGMLMPFIIAGFFKLIFWAHENDPMTKSIDEEMSKRTGISIEEFRANQNKRYEEIARLR